MIKAYLVNKSNGMPLKINGEGELTAVIHQHPPKDEKLSSIPFVQYFANNRGSSDFRVNGSANSVDFSVQAVSDFDLYIKTISLIIADAGASLNKYGNLTALTNGTQLIWETQDLGTVIISNNLKTNLDLERAALLQSGFGTGTEAFKLDISGGGADAYAPVFDFEMIFGPKYGIRLRKNTKDRLFFRIRDNLSSGIDQHDAYANGTKF